MLLPFDRHVALGLLILLVLGGPCPQQLEIIEVFDEGPGGHVHVVAQNSDGRVIEISAIPDENGCIEVDCGEVFCDLQVGVAALVKCNDPVVLQMPNDWSLNALSWSNQAGESGFIVSFPPVSNFDPPVEGPFVAEPGHHLVVLEELNPPTQDSPVEFRLIFFPFTDEHAGTTLKALDVARIEGFDSGGNSIVRLEPTEGLGVDFANLPEDHSLTILPPPVPTSSQWGGGSWRCSFWSRGPC